MKTLSGVARNHLQSAYVGLLKSLQQEYAFVQRVTPRIGDAFRLVEQAIRETFIPSLFQGLGEGTPGQGVTCLPIKKAGLALPYPTKKAPENWTASCVITGHLVTALRGQDKLRTVDHFVCPCEGRTAVRKRSVLLTEEALVETLAGALLQGSRQLQ